MAWGYRAHVTDWTAASVPTAFPQDRGLRPDRCRLCLAQHTQRSAVHSALWCGPETTWPKAPRRHQTRQARLHDLYFFEVGVIAVVEWHLAAYQLGIPLCSPRGVAEPYEAVTCGVKQRGDASDVPSCLWFRDAVVVPTTWLRRHTYVRARNCATRIDAVYARETVP